MGYNDNKRPMPQLRLPADYVYNPLYFVPQSKATPKGCIDEDDGVKSLQCLEDAVLPATTYLHRPLHFSPSSSNATPVRGHGNRARSGESRRTCTSGNSSLVATSSRQQRSSSSVAAVHASLRKRGHALTQEVAAWQRRSGTDYVGELSLTAVPEEVTVDSTNADLSTILRPTRATQLREEYVLHYMEERDEAAQNIFFRPKGWPLPGAALSSPCRQHRTSSASPSRNGFLTPTRPCNSSVAYLPAPRFTKAAQLRQQSTVQLMEKLARWELEKAAEEALAQVVAEAGSRRAFLRLRAGARSNSSSTVFAGQQSGSVRDANASTPFNGTHPSHHMQRCRRTPRSGSFGDAVNGVGQHIRATARSVSAHAGPREQRRPAASNFCDDRAKPLKKTEHVAEAAHAPSNRPLLDAPAPLPRSKYRPLKSRKEEPRVPRVELSTAMPNEAMVALSEPASRDGGERVPSPHHGFHSCLHAANLDSENLSSLAIRNVCGAAHCTPTTSAVASPAAAAPQKSEQRVLASGGHAPFPSSKHAILTVSAVRDIESTITLNEHIPLAQRSASSTSSQQQDGGESSSSFVSSIMFTVLSAPQEDIAGVHAPQTLCDSHEVVTKSTQRREICVEADDSSVEFQSTGRGDWKHSASLSASLAAVSAARPYLVRSAELSPVASPNLSCVPSPTHTSTSVASDEVPMSAATTAVPQKQKTESSCSEEDVERIRRTLGVHECRAPRRLLEQVSEGLAQEPSAQLSERLLERRGDHPPPGDAYETPAHAHQTPATQHADDVGWGSLFRDSHLRDSSMSSSSGEAEAQRLSWSESTDWSARVSATPPQQPAGNEVAEGVVGNMMTDAEEQWDEGSVVSTQSSFTSIASYHTEVHVRVLAVRSEAVNEALEAGTSQTESLAHCSTAKPSSAAFESRIDHRAVHNRYLKSGAPAVSHGGEASRAADETQAHGGDSSAAQSSPSWLWNASEGITFGLCGFAPSTASGESDVSRSVVTDAYTVVAGGGCSVFPSWGLPVPPTNCTHMTAAKEARQRTAIEGGLTKWCTTLVQPSKLSVDRIPASRVREPTVVDVGSMLRHLPQTEVAVKKEALDSLRLPQLHESGRCTSAPPVAERPPNNAVAESTETATKGNLRPEVVPDKARALAHEKTIDDAPDVAVPVSTVVGFCTGARWDADDSSVQGEAVYRHGAQQFPEGVMVAAAPEQSSLYLAGAQQPTATKNAVAVPLSVTDAPSSRAVFSRSSCVAIGREDRASEKVRGDRPAKMGGAPPSSHATVTRSVRGADDSVSDGTAGAQTAILASPPHALADTHAEADVKKAIDPPDAVVLCDGLETALVARSSNSRSVTSSVRESAQPEEASAIPLNTTVVHSEDTTSHLSRCSSAEVGGADCAQPIAAVSVKTSLPLSAWPRALELASTPGSIMAAEHGSFSVHFTEAEQSPRERSVYTRQAASFSNSGGEEELGEGGPHSHAPTPPQYRLPQQRNQETPPYEVVLLPGASAAEERNSDATVAVTFSRSDASTRCVCASPDVLPTYLSVLGLTSGKAEGTPAMPYGAASSGFSAVEEQSRVESDRAAAAPSRHTLDSSAPPSLDVTLELEAVPAQCSHDSPAGVLSSWTSSSTEFVARSPSSSPSHSSSSSAAPMATGRLMPMPLEELDASRRSDGGKVDFQLIADSDCDGLWTGDAVEVNRNIFSSTTSCDSLPNAAEVKPTEPASTDAAVMITPCRPRSPFPGSDFNTSCSQVSERITWSVGTWVDRERASASPDHVETCAAESDLGVLSRGTRSAPTVPLMQSHRGPPMASSGGTPLFSAPFRQKRANKPVLESVRTLAEYAERRHELLAIIHDGLEDHVRKMEERASEAVAHSVAVAEACRAQEAECLEYIEELENRVRDLHRTKRECVEELKAVQQSAEARRQELEKELHDLRQSIDEMRRQKLLVQEQQLHYKMRRDAAKHRYDMAEACLTDFTAKVEFRFQEAVTSLQAAVQERKRWADEECALNEKRVREAELLAEQSDFSAFLRRATEEAERTGAVNLEERCAAAVEPQLMRNMERDIEELAASVAARLQVIVEQQSAAKAGLAEPPPHVTKEGPDSIHTWCRTAPQPPSEGYQESWRRDERDTGEAVPACHAISTLGTVEVRVKHALRDLCEGAPLASSIQCAHDRVCLHESATRAATPLHLSSANAAVTSSAPSPSPHKELSPTSVRTSSLLGSSSRLRASATGPEHRLIDNYSWSADKLANIFTPRK